VEGSGQKGRVIGIIRKERVCGEWLEAVLGGGWDVVVRVCRGSILGEGGGEAGGGEECRDGGGDVVSWAAFVIHVSEPGVGGTVAARRIWSF
jgi:hypothetical protein